MKREKGRGKKWERLVESIKKDAALGRVTVVTFSARDMEDTARRLTVAELRNVRFEFFGLSLQRLAIDASAPSSKSKKGRR